MGDLGRLCRGVRVDRLADLSVSDEPARAEEKREGQGKPTSSRLTVAIKILLEASGIHPQKDALKEDQRVGVGVQPPNHPERIAEDESPESDHPSVYSLRTDEPR